MRVVASGKRGCQQRSLVRLCVWLPAKICPMRLSDFILTNIEAILGEWEAFAGSLPPGASMAPAALRNDAERMLRFIAADLETDQSDDEQVAKARGRGKQLPEGEESAAHDHGLQRLADGFDLVQMVSEYRALRGSVTRLWAKEASLENQAKEMIRFNESIDQILAESVERFTRKMGHDKDLFLAVLGHDLRNPLSTIQLGATVLQRSPAITARDHNTVQTIARSAERMRQMVHDLLDFTRTRLGARLPITANTCDLSLLCQGIAAEFRTAHPDRTISIATQGDCRGQWDEARIQQLISNLLGNAIQHGYRGTDIGIVVNGTDADAVTVGIRNRGPVIAEWRRRLIFDPLVRGVDPDTDAIDYQRTSLGLGLYIVHEIATAHGGSVTVTSDEVDGTTFRVELPRHLPT